MNDIRYGLLLPGGLAQLAAGNSARGLLDMVVGAERAGFDSVWAGDSLVRARVEPLALLAAAASVTERITLGTAALIPAYRHPVQAALTLASLDLLSEGRLILGVGAGFPGFSEPEFELSGVRFKTRFSHLDDTVRLWPQLWSGNSEPFHGKVLRYDWLPEVPSPHRPGGPPVWLAGITPAALARTGRLYDGWLPYPPETEDYSAGLAAIEETREAEGRPADAITPALFATVYIDDDADRGRSALEEYCQATYNMPLEAVGTIQVMITGSAEHVAAQLDRYVKAGARHLLIRIAAVGPESFADQLDRVAALLPG
ncbi:alkanesulfonate monooxygenase SsuD/methylene tetrahydromethanopterin reductase-like flavin-dependent oxidoreductase (luciferase family) [Nocardia transvalensis]|uniref:Alkanesulfonate monooxygenase SsuD/methylene tetrahydromethanopterin reductase-like flavin-dependent oxidoreductase (Luciferase family) n=1 Tax=Nocardia transvalensis TaxID=37333 RepID=A0A7W9PLN4_9NOCA|nr:LLM class flavin-dependent oxidoreductase [Nocardia transvalensis]MBB5918455.1 alkanesulfonate monooxygenase SsuD/methylene tetrahydromethanopterin reductase-like flavin-dependent oxidoreductase (luciferase family) [Nocardia transvalensis]